MDNKYAIGKMEDIMEVIHVAKKGNMLDTLGSFHIYKETGAGNQINDKLTVRENAILEVVEQGDSYRGNTAPTGPQTEENNSVVGSRSPPPEG